MSHLLNNLIETAAEATPEITALSYRGIRLSYGDLQQSLESTAAGLQLLGLKSDARIAIYLPKQLETVQAIFATCLAGAIFVPVNPLLKPDQVAHILENCGATMLITSADRAKLLADILPSCLSMQHLVYVGNAPESALFPQLTLSSWQSLQSNNRSVRTKLTDNDTAAILYTSGSTGKPKGVVLSHRNLVLGAESVSQYLGSHCSDRVLAVLPLSFDYGLSQLTTAFHTGASVILMNYLLPQDILRIVSKECITTLAGVPSLWMQLSALAWPEDAAKHLKTITNSGGHLPSSILAKLQESLPTTQLFLMYGLTEAFRSSYLPPEELVTRPTSMGKAIPHVELAVVRPDGSLCDSGESGELVHAGPLVAKGYWNDPEQTERYFRAPPIALPNHSSTERVLWTGDTVTMDDDGYLYFVGREDDMIKSSGYRISPTEVEEVIYASGLIREAAIIGVPHPSLGEAIVAIVTLATPKTEMQSSDSAFIQQLLDKCRTALPSFMLPAHIEIRASLPKSPNGKIDRLSLKQKFHRHFATQAIVTP